MEGSLSLGEACIYALIGFSIVFAGILIIIFIIWLIGLLMKKTDNLAFLTVLSNKMAANKSARAAKKELKKAAKLGANPATETESAVSDEIPDEVKAAIIAAIACYYTADRPQCEFKVKRIKRI